MSSATARLFVDKSTSLLAGDYLPKVERCLASLGDDDVWWRPNDASNSVGNLVLHLCGNMTQWIIGGVGQRPYERARQLEFDERGPVATDIMLARLRRVVAEAVEVIGAQTGPSLAERRRIQDYDTTVLEAIYHVIEHFSMHTGQIITITKMRVGRDMGLWVPQDGKSQLSRLKSESEV